MALTRWEPFREIDTLQRQMNRLFEDFAPSSSRWDNGGLSISPAAELNETADAIHLKLEVPGMNANDLNVEVTSDAVSISGERRSEHQSEKNGVTRSEFRYGKFQRVIPLPSRVQNTDAKADYKDGILTLTLPKLEEEKNKVVKVNIG
jgi:HSP20 family protein